MFANSQWKLGLSCFLLFSYTLIGQTKYVSYWERSDDFASTSKIPLKSSAQVLDNYRLDTILFLNELKKTVVSNGVKGKKARVYFPNHNKMFEEYEIHETSSFSAQLKNKFPSILSFVGTAVSDPKKRVNFTYSKYTGLQATFEQTDRIPLKLVKANDESVYQLYWASDIQRTDEERIHCDLDTERDHRKLFDPKKTISAKKKLLK